MKGLGEAAARILVVSLLVAVGLGLLATVIAVASGRGVWSTIAITYYLSGCVLFLVGAFPSGGYSLVRGTSTRRRPIGSRQDPIFLSGLVLVALGFLADIYLV